MDAFSKGINRFQREDPTFRVHYEEESKEVTYIPAVSAGVFQGNNATADISLVSRCLLRTRPYSNIMMMMLLCT